MINEVVTQHEPNRKRTLLFLILFIAAILLATGIYASIFRGESAEDQVINTTGAIIDEPTVDESKLTFRKAVRKQLPIFLQTGSLSYDYKKSLLTAQYCGDYTQFLTELRSYLDQNGLADYQIEEDAIIFTDDGECK